MNLGAVLIAAGSNTNPMHPSGEITVAQRMIASLQKAGVTMIAVVTGPEDKKMEKQLAQYGVYFLQNPQPEREDISIRMGLEYVAGKCERIFLMETDRPLVSPDTLMALNECREDFVVPVYRGVPGQPLMLASCGIGAYMEASCVAELMERLRPAECAVEDPGVVLTAEEASWQAGLIAAHERKLTRLISAFSITRGKTLVDGKMVVLLRLIRETQSVRDACTRMQISYSTAWNLLNGAEEALGYSLILRNKGGPSGSGSLLTEKGDALLTACDRFETAVRENLDALYGKYLQDELS